MEILELLVSVPMLQISLFIVLVSICFLFERSTLGLFIAFILVFYWASYVNREALGELLAQSSTYPLVFYGGVMVLVFLSGLGLLSSRKLSKF